MGTEKSWSWQDLKKTRVIMMNEDIKRQRTGKGRATENVRSEHDMSLAIPWLKNKRALRRACYLKGRLQGHWQWHIAEIDAALLRQRLLTSTDNERTEVWEGRSRCRGCHVSTCLAFWRKLWVVCWTQEGGQVNKVGGGWTKCSPVTM